MLPITAYAAKIAASTTVGAVTATASVLAATDPTVALGGAVVGGGTFIAGVYKLLSDHSAQKALRETLEQAAEDAKELAKSERTLREDWQKRAVEAETQAAVLRARLGEERP